MELEDLFEGRDVLAEWVIHGTDVSEATVSDLADDETPWVDAYEV